MTLSEAEISAMVKEAADGGESSAPSWAVEMKRMLEGLVNSEFRAGRDAPLSKLCEAGADYGWQELEGTSDAHILTVVLPKAQASLRGSLRRRLERLTRPCLELQRTSFEQALNSLGLHAGARDPIAADRMFLRDEPSHRLFSLFKKFPVLARLWAQTIFQWRSHVAEVLLRFTTDRVALSQALFDGGPIEKLINLRCDLSDPHHQGRTVMLLQFETRAVIYKPRPGDGEWEWGSLMEWMNTQSFAPRLKAGRVLRRKGYCWMERVEVTTCKNHAAARRFYERIGGMIAAAYLLKAVDCHRENVIASGEDPVLVDADALWHFSPGTKAQAPLEVLYRTGFFRNSNSRSLQSRSSVLGGSKTGQHVPRIGTEPLDPRQYKHEIVRGFDKAWNSLLGTKDRRRAFARRLQRIRSRERRSIHGATEKYAAIRRASIQPAALRSGIERNLLIARLCQRDSVSSSVIQAEIYALKELDIPYFVEGGQEHVAFEKGNMPVEVGEALRRALA